MRRTDGAWLEQLYDEHGAVVYRYALVLLFDPAAAEDAVQQTFCNLLGSRLAPEALLAPRAYLLSVVRHHCFRMLQKQRRARLATENVLVLKDGSSVDHVERLAIQEAMRGLPPEQREVLFLRFFEGLSFVEIGRATSASQNTAASRYRYALASMRRTLGPRD